MIDTPLYLIDTNVISEARKAARAHPGVRSFFRSADAEATPLYIASITLGELRRGVDLVRRRGDKAFADQLEIWLAFIATEYKTKILSFDAEAALLWGRLCVPEAEPALDKQIAAIALLHDLTIVTRNTADFKPTGVRIRNPWTEFSPSRE